VVTGRFAAALAAPGLAAVAEIKRRSPSAGDLRRDADPAAIAAAYSAAGAAATSVLVDERFAGSWDDLAAARAATDTPLLAKGFFVDEGDLETARRLGADAALLLLRDLDDDAARRLMEVAADLGLDTLVEAHDAAELARAIALEAPVVGVNARDLDTFAIDRRRQLDLVASIPPGRVVVAESGIRTRADGAAAELAGADAILVGSTLMTSPDPAGALAELIARPLVKVCGLTRPEDVAVAADAGADLAGFVLVPESPRAASAVLPTPDGMLSVAVCVGEASEGAGADLDQVHTSEPGLVRGRRADLLRDGRKVASFVDRAWGGDGTAHWAEAAATPGRVVLAGGLDPGNVAEAVHAVNPWAVDASSSLESEPGIKDPDRVEAFVAAVREAGR
jgi:indole-3-glycerol phosphate synthase